MRIHNNKISIWLCIGAFLLSANPVMAQATHFQDATMNVGIANGKHLIVPTDSDHASHWWDVDSVSVYSKIKHLFGSNVYAFLLQHDEFVKMQDIAINFMEEKDIIKRVKQ